MISTSQASLVHASPPAYPDGKGESVACRPMEAPRLIGVVICSCSLTVNPLDIVAVNVLERATSMEHAIEDAENKRRQVESEVVNLTSRLEESHNIWAQALVELFACNSDSKISVDAISLISKQSNPRFASLDDFMVCPAPRYTLVDSFLPLPYDPQRAVTPNRQPSPLICRAAHIDWYIGQTEA